jgi:molybdopterin-synthase adenylyltransferase
MGAMGNLMLIQPGKTPCLACLYPESQAHAAHPTADELGIIGPAPAFAASWAAAQALKFLSGSSESLMPGLFQFNLWKDSYEFIPLDTGPVKDCPVCGKV